MVEAFDVTDGDLILVSWHTSGTLLAEIVDAKADATVFVVGPTIDRAGKISVGEFARRTDLDVLLSSPKGETLEALHEGHAQFIPSRLVDIPLAMERLAANADRVVGIIETSPPVGGTVTPGITGLAIPEIVQLSDLLIAEINENEPRMLGLSYSLDQFDDQVNATYPLPEYESPDLDDRARTIGENVARVIPDGATLQFGIGEIPDALGSALADREGLGLHTGLVTDTVRGLIADEVITRGSVAVDPHSACDLERPGVTIAALGPDQEFYDWLETSKKIAMQGFNTVHRYELASQNDNFVAINSAVEVDVNGQVNAERIQGKQVSGPGGQPDFMRIARLSRGGVSVITLPSTTDSGISKIVDGVGQGDVVTTPYYEVDYVVTEHGVADLRTATRKERVEELVRVATPEQRSELRSSVEGFTRET